MRKFFVFTAVLLIVIAAAGAVHAAKSHPAYILGYEDGSIRPNRTLTRAEAAAIFCRLLPESRCGDVQPAIHTFIDVAPNDWYGESVSAVAEAGLIVGYPDGAFRPDAPITRAEFAVIVSRFSAAVSHGGNSFPDVPDEHWAERQIARAEYLGWINGYPDGSFKPDQPITRAEAITMLNRVLERAVETGHMLPDMISWRDCSPSDWFYEAVQEATNAHTFIRLRRQVPALEFHYESWQKILQNT